jgi:hypothetical protein
MSLKRIVTLILVMLCATIVVVAQEGKKQESEHFAASAYSMNRSARMVHVDIRVKEYTDNERTQQFASALVEGGQPALTKALEKADDIGSIQLTGQVGLYDFKRVALKCRLSQWKV